LIRPQGRRQDFQEARGKGTLRGASEVSGSPHEPHATLPGRQPRPQRAKQRKVLYARLFEDLADDLWVRDGDLGHLDEDMRAGREVLRGCDLRDETPEELEVLVGLSPLGERSIRTREGETLRDLDHPGADEAQVIPAVVQGADAVQCANGLLSDVGVRDEP
jgi:hypothetical protein